MKSSTLKTKSFNFKQFSIEGGHSGMPVSTDGVLLGAWARIESLRTLLDVGTGTGLLALMCAQRSEQLAITAVDIDHHAIESARYNFQKSPWSERINLHEGDILELTFEALFDGIICNPPYFNSGEQSQHTQRATARHTDTLSHKALLKRCYDLTTPSGSASFILPAVEGEQLIALANTQNWHVRRLCHMKTTEVKKASRLLIELSKVKAEIQENSLTIHNNEGYSDDFRALTQNFYLKM
ncbi:tRNA1(Val) (adenine(37)-N6)-methyltransferase [Vibrio amylolyticus]|uniref:tRNA1(Val) (adenine(37)-N6)-methyltransferase n=1 Tax=Vibrio amylolyticus TaxID=2847292 RepID=UPI0035505C07